MKLSAKEIEDEYIRYWHKYKHPPSDGDIEMEKLNEGIEIEPISPEEMDEAHGKIENRKQIIKTILE